MGSSSIFESRRVRRRRPTGVHILVRLAAAIVYLMLVYELIELRFTGSATSASDRRAAEEVHMSFRVKYAHVNRFAVGVGAGFGRDRGRALRQTELRVSLHFPALSSSQDRGFRAPRARASL